MKIVSLNCNGLRAAISKGLESYIIENDFDIVCLQEVKSNLDQIESSFFEKIKLKPYFFSATKKGYSGVACFSKFDPIKVEYGLKHEIFDSEGRSILLHFKDFTIWNLYFPSGTTGDIRQSVKMEFLDYFLKKVKENKTLYPNLIICGDVNIAHQEIDIHNPVSNKNTSGFLPEERQWLTNFLNTGFIDCFRFLYPKEQVYSWWTYRSAARKRNKGWRIDYFFVEENLKNKLLSLKIDQEAYFSDHTSLILDIKF